MAVVGLAGSEETGEEAPRRVAGDRHCRAHGALHRAVVETGGRDTLPGLPTAAPLTAMLPSCRCKARGRRRRRDGDAVRAIRNRRRMADRLRERLPEAARHGGAVARIGPLRGVRRGGQSARGRCDVRRERQADSDTGPCSSRNDRQVSAQAEEVSPGCCCRSGVRQETYRLAACLGRIASRRRLVA